MIKAGGNATPPCDAAARRRNKMAAQADADDSFSQMSTKALKRMLEGLGVSTATCVERGDLLKLAERNAGASDEGVDALYALSDPHSGDRTNMRYLSSLPARPRSCLLYTSPSPRDLSTSRMPSSA